MNKQYLSIPVQYDNSNQLQIDDVKIPVSILVMHDKINLNNSNFDFEVIDNDITKESIKNIPILGYIKKVDGSDSQDFSGHEMEVVFKDGDMKVTYLERPIGVCPETNYYEYVEKDGKNYVKVIGYLWKDYLNSGYEILQENPNKSVSMEIVVDSYEVRKDGVIDIKAYRYTGITVLGGTVMPGMKGANMEVIGQFSNDQKFSKEFYERVEKLNNELKVNSSSFKISSYFIPKDKAEQIVEKANSIFNQLGFECIEYIVDGKEYAVTGVINKVLNEESSKSWGFDIYDNDTITIYSLNIDNIDMSSISMSSVALLLTNNKKYSQQQHFKFNINSIEGGETGQVTKTKEGDNMGNLSFSATYRQKRESLSNALDPIIVKDDNGETIEETYYYVEDFDDDFVYVEKYYWSQTNSDFTYGRYTYSFDETGLIATITGEFEKMILVWLTEQENQDIQNARDVAEGVSIEYEALKIGVEDYKNNISTLETEKVTLSEQITTFETSITSKDSIISELQEYKNSNELEIKKSQVDEIISDFEVTLGENEEFELIKIDAMTYEVDILQEKLFCLEGKIKHTKTITKTKKPQTFSSKVSVEPDTNTNESYYGDAVKYLKK